MRKFFLGACLLTAAMLQPHAPAKSIAGGMGLAALVLWAWSLGRQRGRPHDRRDSGHNHEGGEIDT